jgi:hypothetical protein
MEILSMEFIKNELLFANKRYYSKDAVIKTEKFPIVNNFMKLTIFLYH